MSSKIIKRGERIKQNSSPIGYFPRRGERQKTSFDSSQPRRGEIYWTDFTDEEEEKKTRKFF
ncbi:MAG: hypothetical protein MRERV_4c116 [Mycoplasmataceae bacterium RV_VA103A]|nr:MAG: hypothetical protein MRERV_4c116 [Mycoplasmataceae bacterium RV_VA103A]